MSKNLTRKGIAFGALVALGASVFAGTPVNAAGLVDKTFVSLLPNTGTEYSVLSNGTFDLKSNMASTIAGGGNLKYLVADAGSKSRTLAQSAINANLSIVAADTANPATTVVRITKTHNYKVGDYVTIAGATGGGFATFNGTHRVIAVSTTTTFDIDPGVVYSAVTGGTISVTQTIARAAITTAAGNVAGIGGTIATSIGGTATDSTTKRAADGSYVISSNLNTTTADKVIRLVNTDNTASLELKVTAWIDSNGDNAIDSTEYTSEERTVKFLKDSDVVTTTVLEPVSVGDSTLVGSITTSPVLNGNQVGDSVITGVGAEFTRQGSTATSVKAETTVWSDTTKKWTATSFSLLADGTPWTGLTTPTLRADDADIDSVVVTAAGLVTVTTALAHNLLTGDKISFTVNVADTGIESARTVAPVSVTVTGVSSFTYTTDAVTKTAGSRLLAATLDALTGYTIQTYGSGVGLADRALAGTNTVKAMLGSTGVLVAVGSATAGSANTRTAAAINPEILATVNTAKTDETESQVRKGTTAATVVVSITDVDGVAVAAGVNAVATITATTGTFTVNGTAVIDTSTVSALTDANGQARFVVGNVAAVVDNTITLTIASEGVTGVVEKLTWEDSIYRILDLADQSTNGAARNRAVADKAAYTFNFLVQDQFRVAAPATLRLLVAATGNTISTQSVDLVAGKATYSVADGGLDTGDTTVAVQFQLLTGTTWATVAGGAADEYIDWNGLDTPDLANVVIKYYDQIDALTLNADATSSPSTTPADFAAATTTKALVAVDSRISSVLPTIVDVAGKAVVSGAVKNSVTGAAKAGQVVSFSGAGLMFKSGDVWSVGSATAIANDGTFSIDVYSNNPGTKVVTVSVGSITSSASLVFTGASSDVRKLTITGDQYPAPGSTLRAEILLVDGNGNGVDTVVAATIPLSEYISVSYNGPGLLSGSALPTETDADGKASVRYLLGTADRGIASVTVKFDANFDGDFVDATDITVTRVYNIGGSPVATAAVAGSTNRIFVSVSNNTLARNVVVKIAGRTVATLKGSTAKKTYVVPSTKGLKKVTVYVGGKLIANKTVTVK